MKLALSKKAGYPLEFQNGQKTPAFGGAVPRGLEVIFECQIDTVFALPLVGLFFGSES
jgi:hypothetical protein